MKKVLSLVLAVLLAVSLLSCKGSDSGGAGTSTPPPATSAPAAPPAGGEPAAPPAGGGSADGFPGYITDPVDHFARDKYKFVYAMTGMSIIQEMMIRAMGVLAERFNFELIESNSDSNNEVYLQNLETMAVTGVNGFLIDGDPNISVRIKEVLEDLGIPYVAIVTMMMDENNKVAGPSVTIDSYNSGKLQADWFNENWKTYWPDVKPEEIAYLDLALTTSPDIYRRSLGCRETFQKDFPEATQFFEIDMINAPSMMADGAYDMTVPVITTNPDVKYWYVHCALQFFAQGVARAVEAYDMEDRVLITTSGLDILMSEWETGYDGCWVAAEHLSNFETCAPTILGLIAIADGRATEDSLWRERAIPGDLFGSDYGIWYVESKVVTKADYIEYSDSILAKYGITGVNFS
jgi:ABC-type sugar transport system substrate-binding protein